MCTFNLKYRYCTMRLKIWNSMEYCHTLELRIWWNSCELDVLKLQKKVKFLMYIFTNEHIWRKTEFVIWLKSFICTPLFRRNTAKWYIQLSVTQSFTIPRHPNIIKEFSFATFFMYFFLKDLLGWCSVRVLIFFCI